MAPFVYQPYHNPYAASIAEMLLHANDPAARAAEVSGAAYGRAFENVGSTIAALPQQLAATKAQEQATQIRGLQLDQLQREVQSTQAFEAALKNPANYNPDGSTNDDAIANELKQHDVGAWQHWLAISAETRKTALDAAEKIATIQKTNLDIADKQRQAVQVRDEYLGRLAYRGEQVLNQAPGDPLHARDTTMATVARAAADGMVTEGQAKAFLAQTATANPDQIRQVFGSFVSPDLRAKFDQEAATTAKANAEAAKANAEAENLKAFGRTTPGTPEEQYLTALAKGDSDTAARVLKGIHDTAEARRDPTQQALATELGRLRQNEAQARLDKLRAENEPIDISPDIQTTAKGRQYVDLSQYSGADRSKAKRAANAAGVVTVSKEQANALQEIDNARSNQRDILNQIGDLLPRDAGGRILNAPKTKLEQLFQTDAQKSAFNSWRTAAIHTLRATAGSKGLRINQAEIAQAIENDLPRLTDTYDTAQQKVRNIETMLENAEKSILEHDRSVVPNDVGPAAPGSMPPGIAALQKR